MDIVEKIPLPREDFMSYFYKYDNLGMMYQVYLNVAKRFSPATYQPENLTNFAQYYNMYQYIMLPMDDSKFLGLDSYETINREVIKYIKKRKNEIERSEFTEADAVDDVTKVSEVNKDDEISEVNESVEEASIAGEKKKKKKKSVININEEDEGDLEKIMQKVQMQVQQKTPKRTGPKSIIILLNINDYRKDVLSSFFNKAKNICLLVYVCKDTIKPRELIPHSAFLHGHKFFVGPNHFIFKKSKTTIFTKEEFFSTQMKGKSPHEVTFRKVPYWSDNVLLHNMTNSEKIERGNIVHTFSQITSSSSVYECV